MTDEIGEDDCPLCRALTAVGAGDEDDGPDDDGGYTAFMQARALRLGSVRMPEGFELDVRTGSEGPSHDPYGFVEYRVTTPDGLRVVFHDGLGEELTVNDVAITRECNLQHVFEALVGFDCEQLEWWGLECDWDDDVPCMACGRGGCRGGCCE